MKRLLILLKPHTDASGNNFQLRGRLLLLSTLFS